MSLIVRETHDLALEERGFFDLVWNNIAANIPGIKLAIGGFGLVKSVYDQYAASFAGHQSIGGRGDEQKFVVSCQCFTNPTL